MKQKEKLTPCQGELFESLQDAYQERLIWQKIPEGVFRPDQVEKLNQLCKEIKESNPFDAS